MSEEIFKAFERDRTFFSSSETMPELHEAALAWANRLTDPSISHLHELEQLAQVKIP